jgi:16S rRNA (uracil1498-N3)-methyltransferase
MTRLYAPIPLTTGVEIDLPEDAAHHFIKVLRARTGDRVRLFNGEGGEYHGVLSRVDKKSAGVTLESFEPDDRASPLPVHLGLVISKGDRFDWALQKATELGVTAVTPLFSERCEVRLGEERQDKKLGHWQRVVISACEQCGLNRVPVVHAPQPLADWLAGADAAVRFVLAPGVEPVTLAAERPASVALLVGPEGGLSAAEIAAANRAGFRNWRLGARVFRTETAPVAALSVLQWTYGDFQG